MNNVCVTYQNLLFCWSNRNANSMLSLDNIICVSSTITRGVIPSACRAFWLDFLMTVPMCWATEAFIMEISAPVSRVILTGYCL